MIRPVGFSGINFGHTSGSGDSVSAKNDKTVVVPARVGDTIELENGQKFQLVKSLPAVSPAEALARLLKRKKPDSK